MAAIEPHFHFPDVVKHLGKRPSIAIGALTVAVLGFVGGTIFANSVVDARRISIAEAEAKAARQETSTAKTNSESYKRIVAQQATEIADLRKQLDQKNALLDRESEKSTLATVEQKRLFEAEGAASSKVTELQGRIEDLQGKIKKYEDEARKEPPSKAKNAVNTKAVSNIMAKNPLAIEFDNSCRNGFSGVWSFSDCYIFNKKYMVTQKYRRPGAYFEGYRISGDDPDICTLIARDTNTGAVIAETAFQKGRAEVFTFERYSIRLIQKGCDFEEYIN
jgi:Skp family chaperone for outer membrane proteins